ncbi:MULTISPECIES: glycosyltransferase [Halorussus]|uniref:glycosyltransferase n=1 Tax=Halorussus TaxID=1070314 RepID=UPI0013B3AD25|nr:MULTISPECIES: glycosyltransferase [Halorussus]NHN60108.1 glycosyltransferase [Halorussus sp. JP-T4]
MILRIVEATDDECVDYTICHIESDSTLAPEFDAEGVRVVGFDAAFKFDPRAIRKMYEFFCRTDVDVIHAHLPYAQTLARLTGRLSGHQCIVSTQHTIPEKYHLVTRTLERATRAIDTVTVAVSDGVKRAFLGDREQDDWITIQNGIDVDAFHKKINSTDPVGSPDADPCFLTVGRCVSAKSQDTLIRAMAHVRERRPNAHLHILGDGPQFSAHRELVEDLGLGSHVSMPGHVSPVAPYYAGADVFVLPSVIEGMPVTLLEAMAAGLPTVASDIPGVREVVADVETGVLVPTKSPTALADAMLDISEPAKRQQMGSDALERVREHFSIETTVEAHLELYRQITGGA